VRALKEWLQAPVALGRLDAESARSGTQPPLRGTSPLMRMVGRFMGQGGTPSFEPDVLVDEALDLAPYGVAGRALHTPGHSPGSLSIWLEGGDLLVGDLVMGRMLSPTRPGLPIIADDLRVLEQSMARLMAMRPRRIYASHGGPFTPEAMRRSFPWLDTLVQQAATNTGGPAHDR